MKVKQQMLALVTSYARLIHSQAYHVRNPKGPVDPQALQADCSGWHYKPQCRETSRPTVSPEDTAVLTPALAAGPQVSTVHTDFWICPWDTRALPSAH